MAAKFQVLDLKMHGMFVSENTGRAVVVWDDRDRRLLLVSFLDK